MHFNWWHGSKEISPGNQQPWHMEHTSSHPITEVKQPWALLVLGWATAWEHSITFFTFFTLLTANFPILPFYESLMHSKGKLWATFWHDCHLHTSCIAVQMLLNQNQPLQVIAFSTIGYLWAAQHELPIIKIFIPDFFTVNLFLAPIDRILCHGQFRIEAQSLQKRSDHPLSSLLLQLLLNRVCTSIGGMAPKRSHPAANSRGPWNTPILIQSLKLSNVEPC